MELKFRKAISVILSLALVFGVFAVAVCAEDEGETEAVTFPLKKTYEIDGYTLYATLYDDDNDGVGDFWRIDNTGSADAADPDVEPNVDLAAFYGRRRSQMQKFAEALYNDPDFDNDSRSVAGMTTELQEHYEIYRMGLLIDHTKTTDMGQTRFDHNAHIFESNSLSWELAAVATVVDYILSRFKQIFSFFDALSR